MTQLRCISDGSPGHISAYALAPCTSAWRAVVTRVSQRHADTSGEHSRTHRPAPRASLVQALLHPAEEARAVQQRVPQPRHDAVVALLPEGRSIPQVTQPQHGHASSLALKQDSFRPRLPSHVFMCMRRGSHLEGRAVVGAVRLAADEHARVLRGHGVPGSGLSQQYYTYCG
jgi:hypothetical protein